MKRMNLIYEVSLLAIVLVVGGFGGNTIPKLPAMTPPSATQPSPSPQWNPQISSISPTSVMAGGPSFQLSCGGLRWPGKHGDAVDR